MNDKLRLDAYYYGFSSTGVDAIDKILSAVACAGKAYHCTKDWHEETEPYEGLSGNTPVEWIQNAANELASGLKRPPQCKEKENE